MERTQTAGAIAAARVIMGSSDVIETAYGRKTIEGLAALIADKTAAADLLEAARAALPALSAHEQTGCDCPDSEAARLLRDAIAKAEGV